MGGTIAWVPIRTIYAGAPSHIRPLAHLRSFIRIVRRRAGCPAAAPPELAVFAAPPAGGVESYGVIVMR